MSRNFNNRQCRLCGTRDNLEYCGMCKKDFCPTCKEKYPERVEAMMQEKVFDPIDDFLRSIGFKK
jgi:hypothetical protein